jgi:RecB family exonuclease
MSDIKLSATRIETFLECKYKYHCSYVDRLPKVPSPAFRLGTAVHEALELAGRIWMESGFIDGPAKKRILKQYHKIAIQEGIQDMGIYKEGEVLVKNRVNNFEVGKKIIGLEIKFGFMGGPNITTKQGVPLMGAIDKVIEYDEDTILVVDYKTSKTAPTGDQLKDNTQLSIYDLVASIQWPQYKRIILSLDMLKSEMLYTYRTEYQRAHFEEYLKDIHDAMTKFTRKEAKPQLNVFCPWCDYREYCEEYKKACKKSDYKFLSTVSLPDEDLIKEWREVKSIKKILEMREQEIEMILTEKIKRFDVNPKHGDEEVYIRQNSRTTYDKEKISQLLDYDEFKSVVSSIDKKSIESFMNKNPAFRSKLEREQAFTTSYTSPFLAMRKIRNGKGEEVDVEETNATEQPAAENQGSSLL